MLISLIIGINRYNKNRDDEADKLLNRNSRRNRLKNDHQKNDHKTTTSQNSIPAGNTGDYKISELDKLNKNFFSNHKATALLFEYWIVDNKKEGVNKAARVVKSVDKHSIKLLKDNLQPTYYTVIKEEVENLPELTISEKQEIATEYNTLLELIHSKSGGDKNHGPLPLLQFLEHTTKDEIHRLINRVDQENAALVIKHLPAKKAASLLDRLDKDTATNILVQITVLEELSYKERKTMSEEIFDVAMNLRDNNKQKKHKSENILSILEELPLKEQRNYIEKLQASQALVGEFVHTYLITIDQIGELNNEIIKKAVSSLPTETILDALIGLDEVIKQKILSVRPQREQRLIKMELEQIDNPDEYDTEYEKSILINSIRKIVREHNHQKLI